jgi:hypothetical protein
LGDIESASARRALVQLQGTDGWAVGPTTAPEEWRRAVRAEARRAGLRIRTGVVRHNGELAPWAFALWAYEVMARDLGGVDVDTLALYAVIADEGRRAKGE